MPLLSPPQTSGSFREYICLSRNQIRYRTTSFLHKYCLCCSGIFQKYTYDVTHNVRTILHTFFLQVLRSIYSGSWTKVCWTMASDSVGKYYTSSVSYTQSISVVMIDILIVILFMLFGTNARN